ncbi:hypothetical protein ABU614_15515 [Lysobacter firmicutimachus]|uniref:Uncharacterized protein n=1 Tax=Lysobacter firmicutimachus TaxID=1792846 RepID=A0AAU8ML15_9GAMM
MVPSKVLFKLLEVLKGWLEHFVRLQEAGWTRRELDPHAMRFSEGIPIFMLGA